MTTARACVRLLLGASLLFTMFGAWWIGDLALSRIHHRRDAFRARMLRRWAQWTCCLLGVRIRVRGTPPSPPFLLVTNHLGYLDIAVLATICTARFVAKQDIDAWPILGPMIRAMQPIFVNRQRAKDLIQANSLIERSLQNGDGVVLFPEGTSSPGQTVLPFQPSLLAVPARAGFPVHYATLTYRTPPGEIPASEAACWWGDAEFVPHVLQLLKVSHMQATVHFGPHPLQHDDRKQLARCLHQATLDRFDAINKGENHAPSDHSDSGRRRLPATSA